MRFMDVVLITFLELGGKVCTYMLAHIQFMCTSRRGNNIQGDVN